MLKATKVRLYPTPEQELALAKSLGCARWYWNFALNACIGYYQETGKSLKLESYKGMLPQLKKEYPWLKEDCYSSVLQCVAINNESQVIVVENLNVKGMVKNRKLSKSISDVGWGKFVNFIDYKLKQKSGELVEIDRFFP